MNHSRLCALLALACTMLMPPSTLAAPTTSDPATITRLAAEAYVSGRGPEYIERFSKYNTIIGAKFNQFKYGSVPAAWNNETTNAGDASVLYISAFVNFDDSSELVLTVPPSRVLTNTLIDASDSTSVPNVVRNVVRKFALNWLQDFRGTGLSGTALGYLPSW